MNRKIRIPPSFLMVEKGKTSLLLKKEYKDLLLKRGIDDLKAFIKKSSQTTRYHKGRKAHPLIPLGNGKNMILRQYSHGGLLRSITGKFYLWGMRAFRELELTEEIRICGIPTVQCIGAIHHRIFFRVYQAYFLTLEIPRAKDLTQYFHEIGMQPSREHLLLKRKTIRSVGSLVRQFHLAGFFHGDLQLKNILVEGEQILLIDFDRSYRKQTLPLRKMIKNLFRLNRSAEKWKQLGLPITRTDYWRFFLAYAGDNQEIHEALRKALRTYPFFLFFHRLGWGLEKIVRS